MAVQTDLFSELKKNKITLFRRIPVGRESAVSGAVSLGWLEKDSLPPNTQRPRKQQSTKGQHHQRGEAGQYSCASTLKVVFLPQFYLKSIIFPFFLVFLKITTSHFFLCILSTLFSNCSSHLCAEWNPELQGRAPPKAWEIQRFANGYAVCTSLPPPNCSLAIEFSWVFNFLHDNPAPIPTLPFAISRKQTKKPTNKKNHFSACQNLCFPTPEPC